MRKTLVIAAREYLAAVRTKAFVVSLVVVPLMMGGSILVQRLFKDQVDIRERRFAVIDRTPGQHLYDALAAANEGRTSSQLLDGATGKQVRPAFVLERVPPGADTPEDAGRLRFELSERVRRGELFGFLEIGAGVYAYGPTPPEPPDDAAVLRYQSERPLDNLFPRWADRVINQHVHEWRCRDVGLSSEQVRAVERPVPLLSKGLSRRDAATGRVADAGEEGRLVPFLVPVGLMLLMFMGMVGVTPLIQGVIEEKMQRIAEVLLGSVRPFELMTGKLVGAVGVSLTSGGVYLAGTYWAAHHYGFTEYLPVHLLAWFVVFQVLAVLMYGSVCIAIGAACTDMQQSQTMLLPVMLLASLPMFVWMNVVREPNSAFAAWASFFPPSTPMLMIARLAVPPGIPWWQPTVGAVLVLATVAGCVWAAGRIFRVGILMQGQGARVGEMLRWVFRG